jgi:thiol-disulfide isomerase/thioredoxin
MTRRLRLLATAVILTLGTGCAVTNDDPGSARTIGETSVDVDTAQLRQLKHDARIAACPRTAAEPAADGLPDVTLPCLGGGRDVRFATLRGPMVVNLFAQWCGPCRDELPFYQRLHEEAAGRLTVIGLDWMDTQPAQALQLAADTGVTYPLIADPSGETRTPLRIRGLPGVAFVDADGRLVDVRFLVIRSYDQLRTLVEDELGVDLRAAG